MNRFQSAVRFALIVTAVAVGSSARFPAGAAQPRAPLDPAGKVHIPIGIPDTLDTLKTFVEPGGCFSPGVGSYGVYFWVYDHRDRKLYAPTMPDVKVRYGLSRGRPIPWSEWEAGDLVVRTELCEVRRPLEAGGGDVFVVGSRVEVGRREEAADRKVSLYVAVRGLGPAGWPVREMSVLGGEDENAVRTLLVDGHVAVAPDQQALAGGVLPTDTIGDVATKGEMPRGQSAVSPEGNCSGALRFDFDLRTSGRRTVELVCPVLPGRRAVGHKWDGTSQWAQLDLAVPNPAEGGQLQPEPGLAHWRRLRAATLFAEAEKYWDNSRGPAAIHTPDKRWDEAFAAIAAHAALAMNEGAPDVAVVNYNVFNRDGVYTTSILHKVGRFDLAARCIDYFLAHPFNGRVYPEADNPGQILWIIGEHWKFTRDREWLERVYPSVRKLARMIEYYRTTPGPHWVNVASLDFGQDVPPDKRQELRPGRCDGYNPAYTEAFDLAGVRAAAALARVMRQGPDEANWLALAEKLFKSYDQRFGDNLPSGYGSYCVLWPCRLYPLEMGKGREQFARLGAQQPRSWRYFPLATAHQALLAGNTATAFDTINLHLSHEQMAGGPKAGQGWYAFDEGGKSGPGGWHHLRTTWDQDVAMPHGWANAELHLLLRDALVHEDGDQLVLLAGVPGEWLVPRQGPRQPNLLEALSLPTHFGTCSFRVVASPDGKEGVLELSGDAAPPGGFVLCLPRRTAAWTFDDKMLGGAGRVRVPAGVKRVRIAQ